MQKQMPELLENLATAFIRQAKDYRLKPADLREKARQPEG